MTTIHKIGGKEFSVMDMVRRTVRQDHFLLAAFQRSKIDKVTMSMNEDPKEFLLRLHTKLLTSGCACEVLSAFLIPVGESWTLDTARKVQEHLENCKSDEDRVLVNQLAFEAMTGFFKQGLISYLNSLRSSTDQKESETTPRTEGTGPLEPSRN